MSLYDGAVAQTSITGLTTMWWDSSPPSGNPVYQSAVESTDGSGLLEVDIDAVTALAIGDPGHLMVYKLDGGDEKASLAWQGQLTVADIG